MRTESFVAPRSSLPSRPGAYVERRRLLQAAVCPPGGLLLLTAPAGYGKSLAALALAEEALARGEPLLWIGLEEGVAELPGRLAADPARRHPGEPSLLVLDGVHALGAGEAASLLAKLARGRPAAARFVATTRERLRPGLEGLRAAGLLRELGPETLAFDEEEARAVLAAALGFQPPRQALAALVRTTRGWPACLRLAAAAARSPREFEALVQGLDGEVAAVADYLAACVLGGLDPAWRAFLRVAALPEAIDAELLEALGAGRALPAGSAAELLAEAERRNLLEALDPRRRRYAMHSLLRERLLAEAGREEPAALAELRLLASRRLEERGEVEAAVALAIQAGDSGRAGALIRASLGLLYGRNATLAVASWLRRLPRRRIEADPELGLLEAWTLAILGDFDRALGLLDSLSGPGPGGCPAFGPGVLEVVRVYAERFRTPRIAAELGLRLLEPPVSGGASNEWIRGLLGVSTGDALLSLGELEGAEERLRAALPPLLARGQRSSSLSCLHRLCRLALHRGNLAEARSLLARMNDLAAEDPALLSGGVVETDRAALALLEGRVAEARSHLAEAEEAVEFEGSYSYRFDYLALRVRVLAAAGEGTAARESLDALEALVGRAASKDGLALAAGLRALLEPERANLPPWGELPPPRSPQGAFLRSLALRLAAARPALRAAAGQSGQFGQIGRAEAAELIGELEAAGAVAGLVEALVAQALFQESMGAPAEAGPESPLGRALELAAPRGILLPFIEAGEALAARLAGLPSPEAAAVLAALRAFDLRRAPGGRPSLSPREREVLELLERGLRYKEIAADRGLSIHTVREHVKGLYERLGVHSAREALAAARVRGILP